MCPVTSCRMFLPAGRPYDTVAALKLNSILAGKHRTMGFTNFEPTEKEIETLAACHDVFYLTARAGRRIPVIKRYNPKAKVLMYFASSLTTEAKLHDAGSVDEKNTAWIWQNYVFAGGAETSTWAAVRPSRTARNMGNSEPS